MPSKKPNRSVDGRRTPEYTAWKNMKTRCYNPKYKDARYYSERGIAVDPRWLSDFDAFFADMGPRPSVNHSLERMDNDVGYGPDNCVWATTREQALNRRTFKSNTSGHRGIAQRRGRWQARIRVRGECIHLGTFDTKEEAIDAYCRERAKTAGL